MSEDNVFEILETSGAIVKLMSRNLLPEDWDDADRIYAAKVAELFRDKSTNKLLSRDELAQYLKSYNIWSDEDQAKVDQLNLEIGELLKKLRNKDGKLTANEGRKICVEATDKRGQIIQLSQKKQYLDDITIEAIAEREKIDYLVYTCTVYADSGRNYWESFKDMKNDRQSNAYGIASRHSIKTIYGYDPEFEKGLPENKWLLKYGFINEDLEYVDRKTKEKVDRDGKPIEDIKKELEEKVALFIGEVQEENPVIDDETNQPIVFEKKPESELKEAQEEPKEVSTV